MEMVRDELSYLFLIPKEKLEGEQNKIMLIEKIKYIGIVKEEKF